MFSDLIDNNYKILFHIFLFGYSYRPGKSKTIWSSISILILKEIIISLLIDLFNR